jgi:hypothetical protein
MIYTLIAVINLIVYVFIRTKNLINGWGDPLRWPRDTLCPPKLALTSLTSGGRSVGIVRLRTKGHGVKLSYMDESVDLVSCHNVGQRFAFAYWIVVRMDFFPTICKLHVPLMYTFQFSILNHISGHVLSIKKTGFTVAEIIWPMDLGGRGFESRWGGFFSINLILPAALWPWGRLKPLTEMSTRNLPGG